jgi:sensor histidine kinase YesM
MKKKEGSFAITRSDKLFTMQEMQNRSTEVKSKKYGQYFLAALATGIAIFLVVNFYLESVIDKNQENLAFFVTIYSLAGIFAGRYISRLWISRNRDRPDSLYKTLGAVIVLCLSIIFFGAQFAWMTRNLFMGFLVFLLPILVLSVSSGMLIKLIRTRINNQLQEAKASAEQSQSELKFLQSQLSPHFLFNTLNNIYGISLTQHEKVPNLLLKLSSLLRYSVYDVKELFVPLKNELTYIKDYIEFERLRMGDKLRLNLSFEESTITNQKIAPLLLIVFIENAFKHSKNTTEQYIYIDIALAIWGNSILFSIKNPTGTDTNKSNIIDTASGFGLVNVTKRLEILYKNNYDLEIQNKEGWHTVMLQLKAK